MLLRGSILLLLLFVLACPSETDTPTPDAGPDTSEPDSSEPDAHEPDAHEPGADEPDPCEALGSDHLGCTFWAAFLNQYPDPARDLEDFRAGLLITNPQDTEATLTLDFFSDAYLDDPDFEDLPIVVAAHSTYLAELPRTPLYTSGIHPLGIRVTSSLPVSIVQLNDVDPALASSDTALLLPAHHLGTEHRALSWPTKVLETVPGFPINLEDQRAFVTIIATAPGTTEVEIHTTAPIADNEDQELVGWDSGTHQTFHLEEGDVLNLPAAPNATPDPDTELPDPDLTGTHILSDAPIAVFSGHEQAIIAFDPEHDTCCASRLEEQLLPTDLWGDHFLASMSPGRTDTWDHWRILAADTVTIHTDPPQDGADDVTLEAGEFLHFFSDEDFEITATGPVLVGQFLISSDQTAQGNLGDPALANLPPTARFLTDYEVPLPAGAYSHHLIITRQAGHPVLLDDSPLDASFVPIGTGDYEVARVEVTDSPTLLSSDHPFGVIAIGLAERNAYAFSPGLRLD